MADTKTMEDRIREKAVQEYEQRIMHGAEAFFKSLGFTTYREFNLGVKPDPGLNFLPLNPSKLWREIVKQAVNMRKQEIGDQAVADFLKKVESLSEEVAELRDIVNN